MERVELKKSQDMDTVKYIERKLQDKGVQRLDRHPADGLPLKHDPKKGHGGKYSWEGPLSDFENNLQPAPAAIDENDPNYVKDDDEVSSGLVIGEVEAAKVVKEEGVARIEVDPALEHQLFKKTN